MKKRTSAIAALLVAALALPTSHATAQASTEDTQSAAEQKKEASAHFQRGADLFDEGLYRAALVELQRAYDINPNYRVLYNIAQTHVALGEFVAAIRAFEALLAQGGSDIDRKRQAEVRAQIAELTKRTGTLSVRVEGDSASVTVDGVEVGEAPIERLPVDVGRRRILASAANGATASAEVDIASGDLKEVSLTLVAPAVAVETQPTAPVADEKRGLTRRQKWAIGLLSAGGGIALTGMGVALAAKSARGDYEDARASFPGDVGDIDDAHDRLARRSLSADLLFGGAAAVAVTGAVLLFAGRRGKVDAQASTPKIRVAVTPRALFAEGRF